jgi:hypothetical protein
MQPPCPRLARIMSPTILPRPRTRLGVRLFKYVPHSPRKMNTASKSGPTHKRTEGRAPVWGSEFTSKDAALQRGVMVVLMPLCAAALVVRRMYFIVALRPFPAAPLVVRRRCLIVVPMPMPEAPRVLIVVYRPFPAAPLVVRCMYMAVVSHVVPGPMPAAVASRCCRRRFQQLVCACGL